MLETLSHGTSHADLLRLAELHREAIDGGFLASLGDHFLMRLYKALSHSEHATLLVERQESRIVGFIAGSTSTGAIYKEFACSVGPVALLGSLPKLISWSRVKRLIETALYPSRRRQDDGPSAEVLNFCVDTATRGQGVGQRLFAALADDFRSRGLDRLRIVTGAEQHSAQKFYEASGATLLGGTQIHDGEDSLVYEFQLALAETASAA